MGNDNGSGLPATLPADFDFDKAAQRPAQAQPAVQQSADNGPAQINRPTQYPTATKIENGIVYDVSGKVLGPYNEGQQPPSQAKTVQTAQTLPQTLPADFFEPKTAPAKQPAQTQQQEPKDTGVLAGVKRNTVDALAGLWHAFNQPATDQEKSEILQKVREANQRGDNVPESIATNPSKATLALHRIIDAPADMLLKKGRDEVGVAQDLLNNHQYWKSGNLYLSGLVDKGLSAVPLIGPAIGSIAERGEGALVPAINKKGEDVPVSDVPAERKDLSGAATDVGSIVALEHAPAIIKGTAKGVSKTAEAVANVPKVIGDSEIVDRFIKRPETPAAQHGTPVTLESNWAARTFHNKR
jgi:hypothetical protein